MNLAYYLMAIYIVCQLSWTEASKMVCYYDTSAPTRGGHAKFTPSDMETALQFCSYVIYSHAIITPKTFMVVPKNQQQEREFQNIIKFKSKFPNVKFILSLSGDISSKDTGKFLELLEADFKAQQTFVNSVVQILHKFKFDGLNLDLPLPTEDPKGLTSYYADFWSGIKKLFIPKSLEDTKGAEHRRQLTDLIHQLGSTLKAQHLMLSLRALPNVKSKIYYDTKAIIKNLDFIIISAFDLYTPQRNPLVADYMAPIDAPIKSGNRLVQANANKLVEEWLKELQVPSQKLILGIVDYGRSWLISNTTKTNGIPPVRFTEGPGPFGPYTHTPGFLSWLEICEQFTKNSNKSESNLIRVEDPTKKYGNYAYRAPDGKGSTGLWISYEDPTTAAAKAEYAKNHNLGGVALVDITLDDLHGRCSGVAFPTLKSILMKLLQ